MEKEIYTPTAEYVIEIPEDVSTEVENPHYRVEMSAMNIARGLSHGSSIDSPAMQFQMGLLTDAVRDYEEARGRLSRDFVEANKREFGILKDVNWNLDFTTRMLTITPVGPDREVIECDITVDADDVKPVYDADVMVNVYNEIMDRVTDVFTEDGKDELKALAMKQAEAVGAYDRAKNGIETKYVRPFLDANNISEKVIWKLDFTTKKITITK